MSPEEAAEAFLGALPADEYPYLREMVVDYAMQPGRDENADFEAGLDLILDGLERLLDGMATRLAPLDPHQAVRTILPSACPSPNQETASPARLSG